MDGAAIGELIKLGLPGICILALAIAYTRKDAKIDEIQEKRIAEGRETVKAIDQSTNTIDRLIDVLKDRGVRDK